MATDEEKTNEVYAPADIGALKLAGTIATGKKEGSYPQSPPIYLTFIWSFSTRVLLTMCAETEATGSVLANGNFRQSLNGDEKDDDPGLLTKSRAPTTKHNKPLLLRINGFELQN